MAYAGTSTVVETVRNGRRHVLVTLSETEAASGSEAIVDGVPITGTIVGYRATRSAGTGATIDPIAGRAAAFVAAGQDFIGQNGTAAAYVDPISMTGLPWRYYSATGKLFVRSTASNAAADHTITTEILILDGWET